MGPWAQNTQGRLWLQARGPIEHLCALASPREGPLTKIIWAKSELVVCGYDCAARTAIKMSIRTMREP
jgi:hypothetical protein